MLPKIDTSIILKPTLSLYANTESSYLKMIWIVLSKPRLVAFIPSTKDQWVFCQNLYKVFILYSGK